MNDFLNSVLTITFVDTFLLIVLVGLATVGGVFIVQAVLANRANRPTVNPSEPEMSLVPVRELPARVRRRLEKKAGHKLASHGLVAMPTDFQKTLSSFTAEKRSKPDRLLVDVTTGEPTGNAHQRRIQRRAAARAEQVSRG